MRCLTKQTRIVLNSVMATWLICTPAWADDTEIYFGGSTQVTVQPNVLFILDSSSSMNNTDGGDTTRLERMKMALTNILNTTQDVNVGLMRFSNPGGPVLFPVKDIDAPLSGGLNSATVITGSVNRTIETAEDDVEQSSTGVMRLNSTSLEMSEVPPSASGSVDIQISYYKDDAEETVTSGSVNRTSSDIELMHDAGSTEQLVGLRFQNVNIPQGATITSASIEFEVDSRRTGDLALRIYGEDIDSASYYLDSQAHNISSRTRTSASTLWSITQVSSTNSSMTTVDISTVVQEVIDRSGWAANNHMAFVLAHESGSGYRELESFDGESDAAAILHVTYEAADTAGPQVVALRFNEINIPRGATITSADLSFTANGDTAAATSLLITAEYAGHSEPFNSTSNNITSRTDTSSVGSALLVSNVPAWTDGDRYRFSSGDGAVTSLENVVQTVVNHTDWCGGSSLSVFINGIGLRTAKAFEANPNLAPSLDITYDPDSVDLATSCYTRERTRIINSSSDDAEQYSNGAVMLDSTDLELVTDDDNSSGSQTIGLRFNDIQLDQGTSIQHAYLEFAVDEVDPSATTNLVIKAHDTDNSTTFTTAAGNISTRGTTTASVNWDISTQWATEHDIKRSPNIAAVMNEVLARGSWIGGNSLSFVITGSGNRVVESFDGSTLAPRLVYYAKDSDVTVSSNTVRAELLQLVDDMEYKSGTPIADTLYEAALYYQGGAVDYGRERGSDSDNDSDRIKTSLSHTDSYTGGTLNYPSGCSADLMGSLVCADADISGTPTYITPITESCQSNHIVLLTDGEPSINTAASKILTMTGDSSCAESGDQACVKELISYLADEDQLGGMANDQNVTTHTIGFNFTGDWLASLSTLGGGASYEAESASDLTTVFDSIVKSIKAVNTTFVEPSVTINQFNRFSHRDDVYFALFKPQETAKWYGNLKKYQLKGNPATLYDNRNPQQPAIDPLTGFFGQNSQSFWSSDEDGNQVEKGGAASKIPTSRNLFTNVASSAVLSVSDNSLHENNSLITKEMLNIVGETDNYRSEVLQWGRGLDANDALRYELGDPLHSRPELITYNSLSNPVASTIFFGTNEGFLHAVDINTGIEQFGFIPKELLSNLDTFYTNASVDPRPYGMDGSITIWSKDANNDADLLDSDDHVYLYAGMRRGGRSYYALDVKDISNPSLKWQITSGSGDFVDLGQTWSKPIKSKIKIDEVKHDVLIFAGGYDTNQDNVSVRSADSMGNAIYIVDAETGALIWSGGNGNHHDLNLSNMVYSIPSEVRVIDINRDGLADQLYVGDMGGQVWRADIDNEQAQVANLVSMGRIADLAVTLDSDGNATTAVAADNRRFYYPPDIALAVEGKDRYLSVSVGSGYRAHPLNSAIIDRFYMIKQFATHSAPASYTLLDETDLYDATDNLINQGSDAQKLAAKTALSNTDSNKKEGWYIRMENSGEKILSSSATIQKQIVFTTYEPTPPDSGSCNPAQGTSRAYLVSMFDASPVQDINGDGSINAADRVIQLQIGSIPATPTVIDTLESKPTVWIGPERLDQVDTDVESVRTYWIEENN